MAEPEALPSREAVTWQCEVQRSSDQQLENFQGITVGEVFKLTCSGEEAPLVAKDELHFVLDKENSYALKILEVQKASSTGGEFLVTTYRAPQESFGSIILSDGQSQWNVAVQQVSVESVLPQESAEPPMPYGPYGPFVLAWPLWVWFLIIPLLLILAAPVMHLWQRWKRQRRLKTAMTERKITLSPLGHLHKEQRQILKNLTVFSSGNEKQRQELLKSLRESLELFLLHEFRILTENDLSRGEEILLKRQLKHNGKLAIKDFKMNLRELKRAEQDIGKVTSEQVQQLVDLTRKSAQQLIDAKKKKGGNENGVA